MNILQVLQQKISDTQQQIADLELTIPAIGGWQAAIQEWQNESKIDLPDNGLAKVSTVLDGVNIKTNNGTLDITYDQLAVLIPQLVLWTQIYPT